MIRMIKYRYDLWKCGRSKKRVEKAYDHAVKKAKSENERNQTINEALFFIGEEEREIRKLQTERLCYLARGLTIPIPDLKDKSFWENTDFYKGPILSQRGFHEVKKLIRNERKERRDIVFSWITIIVGLLGAIIGVISVLKQ